MKGVAVAGVWANKKGNFWLHFLAFPIAWQHWKIRWNTRHHYKNATICAVLKFWVNSPQSQPDCLQRWWMIRPICGESLVQQYRQMYRRPNTTGSAWGTPWGSVGPKADALGSHPLGGGIPSQATHFFLTTNTLVPKNSQKSCASVIAVPTWQVAQIWMYRANSLKSGMWPSLSLLILSSDALLVDIIFCGSDSGGGGEGRARGKEGGSWRWFVLCVEGCVMCDVALGLYHS